MLRHPPGDRQGHGASIRTLWQDTRFVASLCGKRENVHQSSRRAAARISHMTRVQDHFKKLAYVSLIPGHRRVLPEVRGRAAQEGDQGHPDLLRP